MITAYRLCQDNRAYWFELTLSIGPITTTTTTRRLDGPEMRMLLREIEATEKDARRLPDWGDPT
jgi:hypothetical protein